jgi:hypothetical protein
MRQQITRRSLHISIILPRRSIRYSKLEWLV